MKKFRVFFVFSVFFILFTFIIFLLKNFIFVSDYLSEKQEEFIEPVNLEITSKSYKNLKNQENQHSENIDFDADKILEDLKNVEFREKSKKIVYRYFPNDLSDKSKTLVYKRFLDAFFLSKPINSKIKELEINLYKSLYEVRWRLKNRWIYIFWLHHLPFKEALAVSIHEFGHYLDLYILKKTVFKDLSDDFYSISWEKTNILKSDSKLEDFVSGYAMTNMYEDFAESFTFYILHNKEFQSRAWKSINLWKKYEFFRKYIFPNKEFITDKYSFKIEQDYVWDTTKLDFDFIKFQKYLQEIEEK